MPEEKGARETLATRIEEIAKDEGIRFPPSLASELREKISRMRLTPAETTRAVRAVAQRFAKAEVDAHESVGIIAAWPSLPPR